MFSRLWKWLAAAGGAVITVLIIALNWTRRQRDKAEEHADRQKERADTAETRIKQRDRVRQADKDAKRKGEQDVEKAVDRARSGRRDHFE